MFDLNFIIGIGGAIAIAVFIVYFFYQFIPKTKH